MRRRFTLGVLAVLLAIGLLLLILRRRPETGLVERVADGASAATEHPVRGRDDDPLRLAARPADKAPPIEDLSTALLAPSAPEPGGDVLVRLVPRADESLPFRFAVVLMPDSGPSVCVERLSKVAVVFPVQWKESMPPWVKFDDANQLGRLLRFTGLPRGRWVVWTETEYDSVSENSPKADTLHSGPASFVVGSKEQIVSLTPLDAGPRASLRASMLVFGERVPIGVEIETSTARWRAGPFELPDDESWPGWIDEWVTWVPSDEDVLVTPIWTPFANLPALEPRRVRVEGDGVKDVEWISDALVDVRLLAPSEGREREHRERLTLQLTPLRGGIPIERESTTRTERSSEVSVAVVPSAYRVSLARDFLRDDVFERTISAPGPVEFRFPDTEASAPLRISIRNADGSPPTEMGCRVERASGVRSTTILVPIDNEGTFEFKARPGEYLLFVSAQGDEDAETYERNPPTAARLITALPNVPVEVTRPRAPVGPTGAISVFVADADGRPVLDFYLVAERTTGGWGWYASGWRGDTTLSELPPGRHRLRVARKEDSLYGPAAAVVVVDVRADEERRAYVRLPR